MPAYVRTYYGGRSALRLPLLEATFRAAEETKLFASASEELRESRHGASCFNLSQVINRKIFKEITGPEPGERKKRELATVILGFWRRSGQREAEV